MNVILALGGCFFVGCLIVMLITFVGSLINSWGDFFLLVGAFLFVTGLGFVALRLLVWLDRVFL